ncbi:hypothetical protein ACFP2T_47050 [Plantactinospora solaniradicis]|uniref:DUF1653 domain-containing protein n=1 Tax=Plantactinospora solaniradicis TaxID=1723736 RepID=A0ABW1KPX4_9ACTN
MVNPSRPPGRDDDATRALRVRRGVLYTAVWYYKQPDDGRYITIVGTYPHGDPLYYHHLRTILHRAEAGGSQIHYERGLTHVPGDDDRSTDDEAVVIRQLEEVEVSRMAHASALGWVNLREHLCAAETWCPHDQSALQFVRRAGPSWFLPRLDFAQRLLEWPDTSRRGPARYRRQVAATARKAASGAQPGCHPAQIQEAARDAVHVIAHANGHVALAWDVEVLPQIAARLARLPHDSRPVRDRVEWLRVGQLPSRAVEAALTLLPIGPRRPPTGTSASPHRSVPPSITARDARPEMAPQTVHPPHRGGPNRS